MPAPNSRTKRLVQGKCCSSHVTSGLVLRSGGQSTMLVGDWGITGSAFAMHCCKAHAKINSTPCKIVTHEDFNLKLGTRDYVADITHGDPPCNFRVESAQRGLPPNRGNITLLWHFCYTVFLSILRPGRTIALILTLNGSNDVFPPKDGPFGGRDDGWRHMGKIFPQNSPKRGVNRQFQAKTPKSLHRNISGTINPTN